MSKATISVIIISLNEESDISDCLQSVSWADEIIVVDSGSTDRTRELAALHTEHVHEIPWKGFGPQKNHALEMASGDWVLSLDCDERVSEQLRDEIPGAIASGDFNAYLLPFRSNYCGRFMRFGEWSGERKLRLFRRSAGRFDDAQVHERIQIEGRIGRLRGKVLHYSVRTRKEMQDKSRRYAELGANAAFKAGNRATTFTAITRGGWAFVRSYILKGGLLDGWKGFTLSKDVASATYQRYAMLARLCSKQAPTN